MGFEDNNDALGFEGEQLDLDGNSDLSMGTGRTKAQRKKGIKTEEVAFAKPKRDRFGRRGDGEETGVGADMLNPDKPTRIAGGFSRREMTPQEVKPLHSENSKFSYLFSEDEEDEDEVSTVEGKRSAVDALAMKGDEADAGNVFQRETRSVIHSQGKPQRRSEPAEQPAQKSSSSGRFSRRAEQTEQTEKTEKSASSRFARRSSAKEMPAEPAKTEPTEEPKPIAEEINSAVQEPAYSEPAADIYTEPTDGEQFNNDTVYADSQLYGYGNPYGQPYGQYPPYPPYGGYPPQNPYMQPYGQQPYPYQYPANYAQPQYIPVGYVFQAGFVPVEMAQGTPRRRRRPSAARSAYRYDEAPEFSYEEQPKQEARRVRAIAARSEIVPEAEIPASEPAVYTETVERHEVYAEPAPYAPPEYEESVPAYESQYDRIAAEIPEQPAVKAAEEKAESTAPSRFARRGSGEHTAEKEVPAERTVPSRFSSRGSSAGGNSGTANRNTGGESAVSEAPTSTGGRFKRRG